MQVLIPSLRWLGWPTGASLLLVLGSVVAPPALAEPTPPISYRARDLVQPDLPSLPSSAANLGEQPKDMGLAGANWEAGQVPGLPAAPRPAIAASLSLSGNLPSLPERTDSPSGAIDPVAQADSEPPAVAPTDPPTPENPSDLDKSPVYQKWRQRVPDVLEDIKRDPSFRTRVRLGLSYFPSTFDSLGWNVGVEDVFLGNTPLTLSGDYQATFTGDRKAGGAELRYYILPLGSYFNVTPVLGYRYLETPRYTTDGLNVGIKAQFVLSRTGGADIALSQTWVAPRQSEEVGITKLSFGYALTKSLRLSTDIEKQNSKQKKDTRFGLSLEWMF